MNKNYKQYGYYLSFFILLFLFGACTKMDATYHDFWKDGEKIYPASADSLQAFSGKNRILLQWLIIGDPTIKETVIYWNNRTDSMTVPIKDRGSSGIDTMRVMINDLPEGNYAFELFSYDDAGNQSVVANVIGKAYGQPYINSLLTRLISNNSFLEDTLHIFWGDAPDQTAVGMEVVYTDTTGKVQTRFVQPDADTTIISDFDIAESHYFKYRTLFLPDSTVIDTFYTGYDSVRVLGPRTTLSKEGWSILDYSSYDTRHPISSRGPQNAIDENLGTNWINAVGKTAFPHYISVDMQEVKDHIYGIALYTKKGRKESPRSASIYISDNGEDWQLMGLFPLEEKSGWNYMDFTSPQSFRYYKAVFEDGYGSDNIVVDELGPYTR